MSQFNLKIASTEKKPNYAVLKSDMEDGSSERRLLHESLILTWKLSSPALTAAQAQEYQDFYDSMYGSLTSFTWTCPLDGVEYTVYFVDGSFKMQRENGVTRASWEFERSL